MGSSQTIPEKYSKEGLYFEAKSAPEGVPQDFWESYSAFANTFGGKIVLGISERDGRSLYVTGVKDPEKTVTVLWDNLNNPKFVNNNILCNNDVRIEECCGKKIIVVDIPMADRRKRPIYIRNNVNSGTFKRNNEGDYHCRMDEIKEMIRDSEDFSQDNVIVESLGVACFDESTVVRYIAEVSAHRPGHPWSRVSMEQFLEASGAAVMVDGTIRPTVAGLLMFGKVSCIRREMNGYFLDYRERSQGDRWDFRIHSNSGDWSGNIYDFVTEVMTRLSLKVGSRFTMNGYTNTNGSATFVAVREAVLNGIIHADYNLSTGVEIQWTPRRITVTNPGTMRVPIQDARKGGRSDPRNGTLMALAMAVGWVERIGSGILAIGQAVSDGDLLSFDIRERTDPSIIEAVLDFPVPGMSSSDKVLQALDVIRERPNATRSDLVRELGVSASTVGKIMAELKSSGRIVRVGSNKTGWWKVVE